MDGRKHRKSENGRLDSFRCCCCCCVQFSLFSKKNLLVSLLLVMVVQGNAMVDEVDHVGVWTWR